jgi:hypothetical protein
MAPSAGVADLIRQAPRCQVPSRQRSAVRHSRYCFPCISGALIPGIALPLCAISGSAERCRATRSSLSHRGRSSSAPNRPLAVYVSDRVGTSTSIPRTTRYRFQLLHGSRPDTGARQDAEPALSASPGLATAHPRSISKRMPRPLRNLGPASGISGGRSVRHQPRLLTAAHGCCGCCGYCGCCGCSGAPNIAVLTRSLARRN